MSAIAAGAVASVAFTVGTLAYVALGLHYELPFTGFLDWLPAPRLPLPRQAGRKLRARVRAARPDGPAPVSSASGAGPLTLVFDPLEGRLRHAETGPMELPQRYIDYAGKAAEGWWPS